MRTQNLFHSWNFLCGINVIIDIFDLDTLFSIIKDFKLKVIGLLFYVNQLFSPALLCF